MLLFLNLKTLVKKMPVYFYMIILVLFFTITGTICSYNYFLTSNSEKALYRETERSYIIAGNFTDIDKSLNDLFNVHKNDIQRIYVTSLNNGDLVLSNYFGESPMIFKVQLGKYFGDDFSKQILIPFSTPNGTDYIGGLYNIGSEEYRIIGISSIEAYEVPYKALATKDEIDTIVVVAKDYMNKAAKEALITDIQRIFSEHQVSLPPSSGEMDLSTDLLALICIILLGLVNLSYIFLSIAEKRKKQQAIYIILGSTKRRIIATYLGEVMILITFVFLLSALFSKYVLYEILNKFDTFFYYVIDIRHHLLLFILYCVLVFVVLISRLLIHFRKTPFELMRR